MGASCGNGRFSWQWALLVAMGASRGNGRWARQKERPRLPDRCGTTIMEIMKCFTRKRERICTNEINYLMLYRK